MRMDEFNRKLDPEGKWLCEHVAPNGDLAPATRLRLDQTLELDLSYPTSAPRRWIRCPDCGTYWRVWTQLGVAKPSTDWITTEHGDSSHLYRHAPVRDIDRVIDIVKHHLPEIAVFQHQDVWPADDEGLWFFQLPDNVNDIQLESYNGMCPFIVEHNGMESSDAWSANRVEEAARMVIDYLRGKS